MTLQPYLFFNGRCEEALDFYRTALDARIDDMMRFRDAPADPSGSSEGCGPMPPGMEDKIMHCSLRIGDAVVMASDGMCQGDPAFQGVSLALTVADEATADRYFGALADGGRVQMPLASTFFARKFGMVADRFGVSWMILLPMQ